MRQAIDRHLRKPSTERPYSRCFGRTEPSELCFNEVTSSRNASVVPVHPFVPCVFDLIQCEMTLAHLGIENVDIPRCVQVAVP